MRTGLQELEDHGYLKRVNRHTKNGNFNGLDWILDDTAGLNRQPQNTVNGKKGENVPKKEDYPSAGKTARRKIVH